MNMNIRRLDGVEHVAPEALGSLYTKKATFPPSGLLRYVGGFLALGVVSWFVASATLSTLLITGAVAALVLGSLIAVGIYALNNEIL